MIKLENKDLVRFGNLELLARQAVEGFITGLHKSPFHGFSVEFAEHRLYNKGESTRFIDWKLFARTEKLFVKKYEEETNLRCRIIIDQSSSMYFPLPEKASPIPQNKIGFSIYAAASLIELLRRQRDAVGLTLYSDHIAFASPVKSNSAHLRFLFWELEKLFDYTPEKQQKKTATADLLHQIADTVHRRSLVILFSDMFGNASADERAKLYSALQHLKHNRHEVILFHTIDKSKELNLEFENRPYKFIDMESGEEIKLNPTEVKEIYGTKMHEFESELKLKCASYGIDFVSSDIDEGVHKVLTAFMVKRSKMY